MAQQNILQNLAQSPLMRGYQQTQQAKNWLGRQAVTGAALPIAAASDVLNKGVNAVNWGLGGDIDYLDTGATGRYLNFAQTGNFANPSSLHYHNLLGLNRLLYKFQYLEQQHNSELPK